VATLDGGTFKFDPTAKDATLPLLIAVYDETNAATRVQWTSNDSIAAFLTATPDDTHYLFCSHSALAPSDVSGMRDRVYAQLASLPSQVQQLRKSHLHFSTTPVTDMHATWLPSLLQQKPWQSFRKVLTASSVADNWEMGVSRLDGAFGFIPSPEGLSMLPVVNVPDPCDLRTTHHPNVTGAAALVVSDSGHDNEMPCSHLDIIQHLQAANASAAIIGSYPSQDVKEINCRGKECDIEITMPTTMIPCESAAKLATALHWPEPSGVVVTFETQQVPGRFVGVDSDGRLVQLGWEVDPSLKFLSWAGQWQHYLSALHANLSRQAFVFPVFEPQALPAPGGLRAEVQLPPEAELEGLPTLELDLALSCPGHVDADCPAWDHVLQLFVCCSPPCTPCQPTVWMPGYSGRDSSQAMWSRPRKLHPAPAWGSTGHRTELCGNEVGRWMTPFRRRAGRWLTDVTHLRPLLEGGRTCRFTLQVPDWAPGWWVDMKLRFSGRSLTAPSTRVGLSIASTADNAAVRFMQSEKTVRDSRSRAAAVSPRTGLQTSSSEAGTAHAASFKVLPLWGGGTFDSLYNTRNHDITFRPPSGTDQVTLVTVITGHGYDLVNKQCAEFCVTSHHFSINGASNHTVTYQDAGTPEGCANHVADGVEPNEHGTWKYGRMGWCDGQEVRPWIQDVTADVDLTAMNRIAYVGTFNGSAPMETETPGYIMASMYLVYSRKDNSEVVDLL